MNGEMLGLDVMPKRNDILVKFVYKRVKQNTTLNNCVGKNYESADR